MPNPDMPPASADAFEAAYNRAHLAARELNAAMRAAAELDLDVQIETYVQDLEDDSLARAGNAPAVEVTVRRYSEGETGPG